MEANDVIEKRFNDFLESIAPMSDAEQGEMVLRYFTAIIEGMDTPTLIAFRAHALTRHPGSNVEGTIIEVIDGQLALRTLR